MAAEIHAGAGRSGASTPSSSVGSSPFFSPPACEGSGARPEVVNKFEAGSDDINGLILLGTDGETLGDHGTGETGVITVSSDRSVRIWLLRDSGQYWPSVCHYMGGACTALAYHHATRQVFVGLETGVVSEFAISDDYNRMDHVRDYHAHQSRVTGLHFDPDQNWILSVGKDKYFQFHCTSSGRRLGGYLCTSWCTCLDYDGGARYVFIGDYSGNITVCKLDDGGPAGGAGPGVQYVNTLKGHTGSIQTLAWNGERAWLFSGSFDSAVFIWDIGGRKGTVYELHGHRNKVTGVRYSDRKKAIFSFSEDTQMVEWDLSINRIETQDWAESNTCMLCNRPFFWNWRAMYEQKQVGLRQHHCRKCGKAVCDGCSSKRSQLPLRGFEFAVRVCESCYINITEEDKKSHAKFYDMRGGVRAVDVCERRRLMATVGADREVKIWSLRDVM